MDKKFLMSFILCLNLFHMIFGRLNSPHDSNVYNSTQRIVGGKDVPKGSYVPYQVSLQIINENMDYEHLCGGSIIAPDLILTSAHCCNIFKPESISVVGGIRDLNEIGGSRSRVLSYKIHENYFVNNRNETINDIAILKIDPLELDGRRMAAVNVNSSDRVGSGVPVTVTGWGRTDMFLPLVGKPNYPTILKTLDYRTAKCNMNGAPDTIICALGRRMGACTGDSGGPLVMSTPNGLLQVGIVSYGRDVCGGVSDKPDVYTRVSSFIDWINRNKY